MVFSRRISNAVAYRLSFSLQLSLQVSSGSFHVFDEIDMDIGQPIKALHVDEEHNILALSSRKVSVFCFPCSLTKSDHSTTYALYPAQDGMPRQKTDDKVYFCKNLKMFRPR